MNRPGVVSMSGERMEQAVDDILEPVWVRERRRALRRWNFETGIRLAAGLLPLWGICLILWLAAGVTLPWSFLGFMTVLMTGAAFSQKDGREHLRERRPTRSPAE
jgi:hypothetical protein